MWEVVAVGGGDGGHDFHGFLDSSTNEVPSRGLGEEGEGEEEEEEGGDGGGDVEFAPRWEGVGDAGEERDAG